MAEEQSKGIQQIEGCEVIYDMGSGLVIAKVPLDKVKEPPRAYQSREREER